MKGVASRYQCHMCLKVWPKFLGCYNQCDRKFFDFRVSGFCILEGFANIVDKGLDCLFFSNKHPTYSVLGDR